MAVGKSGERVDRDKLAISIGGTTVAEKGRWWTITRRLQLQTI